MNDVLKHPTLEFVFGTYPFRKPKFTSKKVRIDMKRMKRYFLRRTCYGDKVKVSVYHGEFDA